MIPMVKETMVVTVNKILKFMMTWKEATTLNILVNLLLKWKMRI
jgi:hypothetical protein